MADPNNTPRQHSVKVPRLYKVAANILRVYRQSGDATSLKNLVYQETETNNKHPNVKAIYAILMGCVKRERSLKAAFKSVGLFVKEPQFDPFLAEVLCTELVFGKKKLSGESRPVTTIIKYEEKLKEFVQDEGEIEAEVPRPRFVRINTLKVRMKRILQHLKAEGFVEVMYGRKCTTYAEFLECVGTLKPREFISDYHLDNLLVFAPKTHFYDHPLYLDGSFVLQDKASCLPVAALNLPSGATVMDACAAPGMKTTQIAAAVASDVDESALPTVYAIERSVKRCETLRKIVNASGANHVIRVINKDFLEVDPQDFEDVEYFVVDPSCSGSGMVNREGDSDMSLPRLQKLAALQSRLLLHALSFPNVKKVAYSTCSVSEEENEKVVQMVLNDANVGSDYDVVPCLPTWERRGLDNYENGDKFVRADSSVDLCNGFFVAVLERKKRKKRKNEDVALDEVAAADCDKRVKKSKKKKKKKGSDN